jgi:Carboxypeptidase regulatory-like domain/TonB dependent receptor
MAHCLTGRGEGRAPRYLGRSLLAIALFSAFGEVAGHPKCALALAAEARLSPWVISFRPLLRAPASVSSSILGATILKGAVQRAGTPQGSAAPEPQLRSLLVIVIDENGVAVSSASLILTQGQTVFRGETNYAGRYEFARLPAGIYQLRVEKEGFFALAQEEVRVGETESVEVTLNHQREFVERVNVTYSPPAVDPARTTSSQTLDREEIVNVPYNVTRDVRYALPLLPGVLQDAFSQVHIDGSSTHQVYDELDGFNITDPVSGLFNVRVNVDAVRSVVVQSSRYPVEYGKASGGIVSLKTGLGDDLFRFSATDFFPAVQSRKGVHVSNWTPRGTLSGPLRKGKAWFLLAPEAEYDLNIIQELPPGADRGTAWRFGNLAKAQVNLTPANILTGSFLVNDSHSQHAGLSRLTPEESTVNLSDAAYLLTARDLAYFPNGVLLESGVAWSRFRDRSLPLGDQPYVITPDIVQGSYFETSHSSSDRLEVTADLVLPAVRRHGRHEFKIGTDIDRISYNQLFERQPFSIVREDGTLARRVTFPTSSVAYARNNAEFTGYAQDRWSPSDRLLIEAGVRLDWDQIVRGVLVSPRLASSYMLTRDGNTKLVAGVGTYYDASDLQIINQPQAGERIDYFYDQTGQSPLGPPVVTSFREGVGNPKEPRFLNWSVGLEHRFPTTTYLRLGFVEKRGFNGWNYINPVASTVPLSGAYVFSDSARDSYDAFQIQARHTFKGNHMVFASYVRSSARSTAVVDFSVDNPVFSPQAGGPLPWDTPNRFLSWGWVPFWWKCDLAYSLDWRTGFPFSVVNENQQLVGPPGSMRFPPYFALNLTLEHRFTFLGYQLALRAGFDDITNRHNASFVNNNIDSPNFLTYAGLQGRALTARLRILGRK